MADWNAIIETSSGDLLRHGFSALTAGGGETLLGAAVRPREPMIRPAQQRRNRSTRSDTTQFHRWNGSAFVLTGRDLADVKRDKIQRLQVRMELFVEQRYSTTERLDLIMLMTEGLSKTFPNRIATVQTWIDWIGLTIDEFATKRAAVNAATSPAEVRAVSLDLAALRTADPNVRVRQVRNETT